jgi:hypothetical protein
MYVINPIEVSQLPVGRLSFNTSPKCRIKPLSEISSDPILLLEETGKQFSGVIDYLGSKGSEDPERTATEADYLNPDFILRVLQYRSRRHVFAASDAFEKDLASGLLCN